MLKIRLFQGVILFLLLGLSLTTFAEYNRRAFKHWIDTDRDCQNTRAEVLIATSIEEVSFKKPKSCVVTQGFWVDPYSGRAFTEAKLLDIDHIIPLKYAYEHGADQWSAKQREQFANDPENTLAVFRSLNRQKGAKGPNTWLPPNPSFVCDYVEKWIKVASKYGVRSNVRLSDHKGCLKVRRNMASEKSN